MIFSQPPFAVTGRNLSASHGSEHFQRGFWNQDNHAYGKIACLVTKHRDFRSVSAQLVDFALGIIWIFQIEDFIPGPDELKMVGPKIIRTS